MTSDEIEAVLERATDGGAADERIAQLREFMESDDGGQFLMFNTLDMADDPPEVEGASPDEDADQLMARYMDYMFPEMLKRGCHPAFFGASLSNALDLSGIEGAESWDRAVLVRYRSRRDILEISG